jgi:LysR family transcriptional regulator, glycine cleavage system transcriptional activator
VICFPGICKLHSPRSGRAYAIDQALCALDICAAWQRLAADELNLTRSAVSHQLRLLEYNLGFDLLERLGKGVALTPLRRRYANDVCKH